MNRRNFLAGLAALPVAALFARFGKAKLADGGIIPRPGPIFYAHTCGAGDWLPRRYRTAYQDKPIPVVMGAVRTPLVDQDGRECGYSQPTDNGIRIVLQPFKPAPQITARITGGDHGV